MVKMLMNIPAELDNVEICDWMVKYDNEDWVQDFPNTQKGILDAAKETIRMEWAWHVQMQRIDGTGFMEVERF